MKAIQFESYGEPAKVLAVQERPLPEPVRRNSRSRHPSRINRQPGKGTPCT
jgi:hypothetical protein